MQINITDKLSMRITMEDNTRLSIGLTLYSPQWSRQAVITVFCSTWMTTKLKRNRHRSFLYRCNWPSGTHVFKLGTEIPNSKSRGTITCEKGLALSRRPFENGTN